MAYKFLSTILGIDANFTGNVGVGTTTPSYKLDVNGTTRTKNDFFNIDNSSNVRFKITDNTAVGNVYTFLSRFDNTKDIFHVIFPNGTLTSSNVNWNFGMKGGANTFSIASYDGTSVSERMLIYNNGNVGIGTSADAGYKLDVNGTQRLQGNFLQSTGSATFANGLLLDSTSRIFSGNTITYQSNNASSQHLFKNDISSSLSGTVVTISNSSGAFGTTSASNFLNITGRLATASGTNNLTSILLNHTVENTGTYTGTIRGIYYNPSSVIGTGFTHRAIETVSGDVVLGSTSGNVAIGTTTLATATELTLGGSQTASSAIARGGLINTTLVASANNDVLAALDIAPTFTNGAFTGVSNWGLRMFNSFRFQTDSDLAQGIYWKPANDGTTLRIYGSTYSGGVGYLQLNVQSGSDGLSVNGNSRSLSINAALTSIALNLSNIIFNTHGTGEAMRIVNATKNLLIGTTTDAGQKLQIAGNQATTISNSGDGFNLTRTGAYDNVTLTTLATITDTTTNANRAKIGLYVNVSAASTNIAIQTVGAVGVGVTPPSNSFASGYFSYLYAGATINSAGNYNLNVRSTVSSFAAGNGGGLSFWGDDRGQAGANTAFAGVRGVKENSTYLNGLGALTFLTQASSAGLSTESTFAEVGRFTSGGNFLIGTTTNGGFKLDVNGTARVQGVITGSVNSGSLALGAAAANSQAITITGFFTGNGSISSSNSNARGFNINIGGQGYGFFSSYNGNNQGNAESNYYYRAANPINITAGTIGLYGYDFSPSITSETNATIYAFSSTLNSASNHFNLYFSGTAKNYLAGNLLIGSTTDNGNKLQVTGNITASGGVIASTLGAQNSAEINVNESSNNLLVYADITGGSNKLYGGGQVKANIYTSSVTTPTVINTGTTVSLMEWYPTTTQGVMIDYVFYIASGNYMRSGTFTAVNDNAGNTQYVDNATPDLNGSTATVTFAAVDNGGTIEFQVTNTSGSPVYMNILTRYIPNIF